MKYYMFKSKDKKMEFKTKKINKKRIIKISALLLLIITLITIFLAYKYNSNVRDYLDKNILKKEISNENTTRIDINSESNTTVYGYSKYITILNKNMLQVYTNNSKPDYQLEVTITNPIYESSNRFLCLAEKGGDKIYLISGADIIWQKDLNGEIIKVNVNKNGYVSVAISSAGYKTVIILYNPEGEELFTTYLPTTYTLDMEISNDNKYLAIAEANSTGTVIQTDIRIISIENAKTNSGDAFINTYQMDSKEIITNIKYQDKNQLIGMYDTRIASLGEETKTISNIDSNTLFADIELNNYALKINKNGIIKNNYYATIINLLNQKETTYELINLPKSVYTKDNLIAINYGSEVEIINVYGWLIKKYKSHQDIKDIIISSQSVGIVYKDKVELIHI